MMRASAASYATTDHACDDQWTCAGVGSARPTRAGLRGDCSLWGAFLVEGSVQNVVHDGRLENALWRVDWESRVQNRAVS